jgi:hypothetical protein
VISEIKKFNRHPDRSKFSVLQVNDFYNSLIGQTFKVQAIISSVRKGTTSDYEMQADTYAYTILHNPSLIGIISTGHRNWLCYAKLVLLFSNSIPLPTSSGVTVFMLHGYFYKDGGSSCKSKIKFF